jgi:hypothetical protein
MVANADGTSASPLPNLNVPSDAALSWLPDSKWLITRDYGSPLLVNTTTSDRIPLPQLNSYYQIAVDP